LTSIKTFNLSISSPVVGGSSRPLLLDLSLSKDLVSRPLRLLDDDPKLKSSYERSFEFYEISRSSLTACQVTPRAEIECRIFGIPLNNL